MVAIRGSGSPAWGNCPYYKKTVKLKRHWAKLNKKAMGYARWPKFQWILNQN
jgi:hypothetical protein